MIGFLFLGEDEAYDGLRFVLLLDGADPVLALALRLRLDADARQFGRQRRDLDARRRVDLLHDLVLDLLLRQVQQRLLELHLVRVHLRRKTRPKKPINIAGRRSH